MTSNEIIMLLIVGGAAGAVSGMLGIGGGVLVIPGLVFLCGFSQRQAVGTSLAMLLPPIGILAVAQYWRGGLVNVPAAGVMAVAFALTAWAGAMAVHRGWIPERALRYLFCAFLLYVAGNTLFRSERRVWATLTVGLLWVGYSTVYIVFRLLGRRWERSFSAERKYQRLASTDIVPLDYEI